MGKQESKELQVAQNYAISTQAAALFEENAGSGFENTKYDDFLMPLLRVFQSTSKIRRAMGANEGVFFNPATETTFSHFDMIVCGRKISWVEWGLDGFGDFRGEHDPESEYVEKGTIAKNSKGRELSMDYARTSPAGDSVLIKTATLFVLYRTSENEAWQKAAFPFSKSAMKIYKGIMTKAAQCRLPHSKQRDENGNPVMYEAPLYATVFRVTTEAVSNDDGEWFSVKATNRDAGTVSEENPQGSFRMVADHATARQAVEFAKQFQAGEVRAQHDDGFNEGEESEKPSGDEAF